MAYRQTSKQANRFVSLRFHSLHVTLYKETRLNCRIRFIAGLNNLFWWRRYL